MADSSSGMVVDLVPAIWHVIASVDNAGATATKAGEAGKQHYITAVVCGFSAAAAAKSVTIKKGSTTVAVRTFSDGVHMEFDRPIVGDYGQDVSAVLGASGAGGNIGNVTIFGFTR